MGSDDAGQLIILVVLVFLSAFFSSAETALTTVNQIKLRGLSDDGNKKARRLLQIKEDSPKMLSAILIGNNIVNLTASSLATAIAIDMGGYAAGIATAILTVVILIFGEITPKTMATLNSEKMAFTYCNIIWFLMKLFTPIIFIVNKLSQVVLYLLRVNGKNSIQTMTELELRTIVDVSHESGVIEQEEREMINNVVDFGDSLAKDIMIPRIDMCCAHVSITYQELLDLFQKDMFTRLPVYEDDSDDVIGIVNIKDMIFYEDKEHFQVSHIMRDPFFTYEYKKTSDLMIEMRQGSIPMAIVLDEYGATAGLVTLEDLLEEIVGEIRDEYDSDEDDMIKTLNDREYSVEGAMKLDDLNDSLNLNLESQDYDSIGGIIIEILDRLPTVGEQVTTEEGIVLTVEQMEKNRIDRVHILLPEPINTEDSMEPMED